MYHYNLRDFYSFKERDKYFLIGVHSLALFELDEPSYEVLQHSFPTTFEAMSKELHLQFSRDQIRKSFNQLKRWGIVLEENANERISVPSERNSSLPKPFFLNGLYLMVSQDCNLRCKYCSAGFGKFGKEVGTKLMSPHTAEKAIKFFLERRHPSLKEASITFTGGEPLLAFQTIRFVVEYFRTKTDIQPQFSLNTNGTLMTDEIAQWFVKNGIPVRFSIDGTKEIHDENRVYINGKGSYDDVIEGLKKYIKHTNGKFSTQASIPKAHRFKEAVQNLWRMGAFEVVGNYTGESAFLETETFKMNQEDKKAYWEQWRELNDEITNNFMSYGQSPSLHMTTTILRYLHTRHGRAPGCGVGRVLSVTPDGQLGLCQGFVGLDEYLVGSLDDGINEERMDGFRKVFEKYLTKCDDCWAKNCCGSGCIAQSVQLNELDEKFEPTRHCDVTRELVKATAYMYATLKAESPKILDRIFPKENTHGR